MHPGIRILLTTAVLVEASACAPKKNDAADIPVDDSLKNPTPTYSSPPTQLPNFRDYLPTLTPTPFVPTEIPTPIPTPTIEQRFIFGEFDFATTPFTLQFSDELNSLLGYIKASNRVLTADIPLPIKGPEFGDDEQYKIFEDARYINIKNPYFVFTTEQPNHLAIYTHSISGGAPGEIARRITSFQIQKPELADSVLGQTVNLNINGQGVESEVVYTSVIEEAEFYESLGLYPEGANILFVRLDQLSLPAEVRNDSEKGTFYISVITCQSENGKVSAFYSDNVAKRAIVTLKFTLP